MSHHRRRQPPSRMNTAVKAGLITLLTWGGLGLLAWAIWALAVAGHRP